MGVVRSPYMTGFSDLAYRRAAAFYELTGIFLSGVSPTVIVSLNEWRRLFVSQEMP